MKVLLDCVLSCWSLQVNLVHSVESSFFCVLVDFALLFLNHVWLCTSFSVYKYSKFLWEILVSFPNRVYWCQYKQNRKITNEDWELQLKNQPREKPWKPVQILERYVFKNQQVEADCFQCTCLFCLSIKAYILSSSFFLTIQISGGRSL